MKKLIVLFLIVLVLVGCANTSTVEKVETVETTIMDDETVPSTTEVEETYAEPTETEPTETTEPIYVFNYESVPAYYQTDYSHIRYGGFGTVKTHGCGITSLAMVVTYLTDTEHLPDELAIRFGMYNTPGGSSWSLFYDTAPLFGLKVPEVTYDWNKVVEALENGQVVIAQANENSVFTDGGHFIVLTGITDDGKILVNDPYYYNMEKPMLMDGFKNGFDHDVFIWRCYPFWIYEKRAEPVD